MKTLNFKQQPEEAYERHFQEPEQAAEPQQYKQPEEPRQPPMSRREIREFNKDQRTKVNKVRLISKSTFWILVSIITLLALALIINIFWLNISIAAGKMNGNVTVNNQVDVTSPDIPVTIDDKDTNNYQHDINIDNKIEIDENFLDGFVDDIVEGVLEGINETG